MKYPTKVFLLLDLKYVKINSVNTLYLVFGKVMDNLKKVIKVSMQFLLMKRKKKKNKNLKNYVTKSQIK